MSEKFNPLFSRNTVLKVVGWGFGRHGFRACHTCRLKQQVSLEQVVDWLMGQGTPPCGRCKGKTELMREDQTAKLAEYRVVTPNVASQIQRSTQELASVGLAGNE